jgi:hypothetical protein
MSEREIKGKATVERDDKGGAGTIRIILQSVNPSGRSSASLPDGTVLVASRRQPFLDAARVLIAAAYHPDSWLEGINGVRFESAPQDRSWAHGR